jgi:hypothetical protein
MVTGAACVHGPGLPPGGHVGVAEGVPDAVGVGDGVPHGPLISHLPAFTITVPNGPEKFMGFSPR